MCRFVRATPKYLIYYNVKPGTAANDHFDGNTDADSFSFDQLID